MTLSLQLVRQPLTRTHAFGAASATVGIAWPLGVGLSVRGASRGRHLEEVPFRMCNGPCDAELDDYLGGADADTVDQENQEHVSLSAPDWAHDIRRTIPSFFDDYDDIHNLASCSRELQSIVLKKEYWQGRHINLVVPALAESPRAIRNAARFFRQAASLTMEIRWCVWKTSLAKQSCTGTQRNSTFRATTSAGGQALIPSSEQQDFH